MPRKNKKRSCKKAQASIAALPKKFSPEEQEAWGIMDSASLAKMFAPASSQLNEIMDWSLTEKVHAVIEANGKKTGPKISPDANQRMVQMLHGLFHGQQLKQVVTPQAAKPIEKKCHAESAQLLRFCVNFYELASMLKKTGADKSEPYVMKVFKERFGFNLPADWSAAKEAYRRGFLYYKRPRRDRPSRRTQVPTKCVPLSQSEQIWSASRLRVN